MSSDPVVLIVEDQPQVARALEVALDLMGVSSQTAPGPDAALARLADRPDIRLVIQDMNFSPGATSGEEGVALFREIRRHHPAVPVMLVTAWGSLEVAVRLMKEGAVDYLEKPWNEDRLAATVRASLGGSKPEEQSGGALEGVDLCGLVFASDAMHEVVSLAAKVARADVPVLITGANGTGKEKLADILQANSRRRAGPWVKVNVAALPADLVEAELFGAEAGAYTGASRNRIGRFERADRGTLLFDEIGELPPASQVKLLRVLQSGEMERLGSSSSRTIDVRVIAATNTDLESAIADGRFREDLYFRLNVIEVHIPSLAERTDDIWPLAEHFLARYRLEHDRPDLEYDPRARGALTAHAWPGNVRELENRIRRACLVASRTAITPSDLGLTTGPSTSNPERGTVGGDSERGRIASALERTGGVVSRAAEDLGMSRQALYRRMERLGITLERRPRSEPAGDP